MHRIESTGVGSLLGLMEILDDISKPVDIAKLDDSLDEERTTLMNLLDDAEGLGLIGISNGDVFVTELGTQFLNSNVSGRKKILKEALKKVEPFHTLINHLDKLVPKEMTREDLENFLSDNFPSGSNEELMRVILNWGRYGKLFAFDADEGKLTLLD
ncbi:MAG: AAA-associated domain-containing protein [Candidatus Thermoplasmatota archaeon]|nr:AAA-associated domain-containing protein [Candidatus Thermoplasmatota archaeon]MCL5680733.1 AAA-associated domain-containing protein [Candidatus Thermoplasmatota archaeon]